MVSVVNGEAVDVEERRTGRWVVGLRRAWALSGSLDRWVRDRGVTGVVWTPASYELDDVGENLASLVAAGARPDFALLWDLAVVDVRAAADALEDAYQASDGSDGYVAVWADAARFADPAKAVAAAAELVADVRRANVAVALAWSGARASVVEALTAAGMPVAVSAVRDDDTRRTVAAARAKGVGRRSTQTTDDDFTEELPIPVFVLGGAGQTEGLCDVELVSELGLFAAASPARVPLSADAEQSGLKAAIERLGRRASEPGRDDDLSPPAFAQAVARECVELTTDEVLEDMWARDHTIWKDDPTEIADRLGWLDIAERMHTELPELVEFGRKARAGANASHVVLCGMGGSVLGAEMFHSVLTGGVRLTVLDTTHPDHIEAVRSSLDLDRTLFVVGSKSGTTVETRAHLEYFWSLVGRGDRFIAITDPGTELAAVAAERGFLRVFENAPDIGGRFSALSYFGLVPAALCGVDVEPIVAGARRGLLRNGPGAAAAHAPGVRLGAALGEALKAGQNKLTLVLPPQLISLGDWIEQLVAESTGKEGTGMLPVLREDLGAAAAYGDDRTFCVYTLGDERPPADLEPLEADHPIVRIRISDTKAIGAELIRWEIATAILGYSLDINPFDQPDVESAKVRAREVLEGGGAERPESGSVAEVLEVVAPPQYIALQAFVAPTDENRGRLEAARARLRERYRTAVTVGFGPRYLHSTGQLHKGGPKTGIFIQVVDDPSTDIEVPGTGFSFRRLLDAQADGDLLALRDAGRPAARLTLHDVDRQLR